MASFLDTTHRNIIWFRRAMESDELQMSPPFQRNPVWTDNQKSFLIDTILRGYPIPEIYMQDLVTAEGKQTHIVVDGQQRIRSCLEFLEGAFSLSRDQSPEFGDASFEDLRPEEKQKIYGYRFTIRLMPEIPDVTLREIFGRLNRNNVALNQQELRQATYWGLFLQTVKTIADNEYWSDTGIFTPNDVRRMLDVEFVSELTVALLHGLQNKKQSLDRWYAAYEKEFEQQSHVVTVFGKVLGEIGQIIPNINKSRWRKKSDFYSLFLTFASHVDSLPLASNQRELAAERLEHFQNQVTQYLREMTVRTVSSDTESEDDHANTVIDADVLTIPPRPGYAPEVVRYAAAVQRAASDLGNRRARAQQLETILAEVWGSHQSQTEHSPSIS